MAVKRALVVDDSKSARAFLARILEKHELQVDNAESAEQAIEYLTHQHPDVIFMDHLMPGMDGFQAVQAIKNDPRTAMIPILMYTSQEGELYLSQARALGALGVLPKQTKPADVSKALYQLHLVPERRAEDIVTTAVSPDLSLPAGTASDAAAALSQQDMMAASASLAALSPDVRRLIESLLREHTVELRRFVVENLETHADRIVGDVRLMLKDAPAMAPPAPAPDLTPPPLPAGSQRALWLAAAAGLLAVMLAFIGYRAQQNQQQLETRLAAAQRDLQAATQRVRELASRPDPATLAADAVGSAAAAGNAAIVEPVPFGEAPFAGARVERVQAVLAKLLAENFQGVVQMRSIPGRFCLIANGAETAAPADNDTPYAKCEFAAVVPESAASRESVAFANMLAAARARAAGALDVQLSSGTVDEVATAYPAVSETLTAGDWNRVAAANNRIEIRWTARAP
jgi:CheY-like chemotaxis protein